MAIDAMEIDNLPLRTADAERKRKSKNKDASSSASPSKKRKQTPSSKAAPQTDFNPESPFTLTTATLYLPLSPISISPTHALASLLAEHLSPLLLTYFPPLKGVILAYSNASISSKPPANPRSSSDLNPQPLTLATTADEYGVLYVYLTATFLVFRPKRGQTLEGWVNVQSEGFLGAVVFNLFSVGVERKRLPSNWKWVPPGEEAETPALTDDDSGSDKDMADFDAEKECFKPTTLSEDEVAIDEDEDESAHTGYFQSVSGHRVSGSVRFRVVDVDVIPGSERDRGFLSIEGTMLSVEEEEQLFGSERQGQSLPPSFFSEPSKISGSIPVMDVTAASAVQELSTVDVHLEPSPKKEKKKEKTEKKEKKEKTEKKSKSSKSKKSKDE
ncbi:uncharacterized protein N7479_010143 [Penicillium vulpinum]|uniref:DNA-directed RNA polymerase subunit n=1 Tax=Penicillium vulpinum TaxID=29845 RepID=A0A1V6RVJ0_9EURO|nr:uncharacterized protein N7479_010143 [Penicillium vulpinum]KAJ5951730.1 hypothetical protein N7479_010143 [Penicillium vulpinum]OQE05656.1 hypothetical protein PENVUL_c023G07156 [Penicillium vulpinum]